MGNGGDTTVRNGRQPTGCKPVHKMNRGRVPPTQPKAMQRRLAGGGRRALEACSKAADREGRQKQGRQAARETGSRVGR